LARLTGACCRAGSGSFTIKASCDALRTPKIALADAILDRIVHNAYRVELSGESLRNRELLLDHDQSLMT
jgi:DNA replication protein DnaC